MDDRKLAQGVTRSGIRSVQVGMTEAEVEELLGAPVSREDDRPVICGPTSRGLNYERATKELESGDGGCWSAGPLNSIRLTYFARPNAPWPYPMLWVHLRNGRVSQVYAKRHNLVDSDGVYWTTRDGGHIETPQFEATFRR
jgi:hypothetical protein